MENIVWVQILVKVKQTQIIYDQYKTKIFYFLVCTCTAAGFVCEDQCETVSGSTSTSIGI